MNKGQYRDTTSFIALKTFHFQFYIMQWFILHSRIWQEELSFVTPWYYTFEMSLDFYTRSSSYIPSHSIIGKPFMRKLSKTIFGEQYLKILSYIHIFDERFYVCYNTYLEIHPNYECIDVIKYFVAFCMTYCHFQWQVSNKLYDTCQLGGYIVTCK